MKKLLITITVLSALTLTLAMTLAVAGCSKPTDGKGLFKSECTRCHVYKGEGSGVIDLSEVTSYRTDGWIKDQITNPRKHDPNTGMPSFGHLDDAQVGAIINYLHGR